MKNTNPMRLWYKQPAQKWEEALPIGNGRLGGMVFGGIQQERIQLNEDTLWSGAPGDKINEKAHQHLQTARNLIFESKYAEAEKLIESNMVGEDAEAYQPLGDLYIEHHLDEEPSSYIRELDLTTGVVKTEYVIGDTTFTRETFISEPNQVLAVRIQSNQQPIHITTHLHSLLRHRVEEVDHNKLIVHGRSPISVKVPEKIEYDDDSGLQFQIHLHATAEEGTIQIQNGKVEISNTHSVTLFLTAKTNFTTFDQEPDNNLENMKSECRKWIHNASEKTFESLKDSHIHDHNTLFNRVDIQLGNSKYSNLATDERLELYKQEKNDPELEALYFQYGRYLLITSSRPGTQPANLQGIWNPFIQPPWNSDYTTNINTEMNYWLAESCNLSECHEPLFSMIDDLSLSGKKTASELYGAKGWAVHHNIDLWRMSTPSSGQASWAFWPMAGAWLTSHLWERYQYTLDEQFLKKKAYPLMKGAAEFCFDWLIEGPDGYFVTNPSTSPENKFLTEDGESCSVSVASTMDMTLIRELFTNCIEASHILNIDEGFRHELENAVNRLFPFQVNEEGRLQEWYKDFPEHEPGHRHVSHLYGLYPGNQINEIETPELVEAARKTLEYRLQNGGGHTGWSCAWLINLFARLHDHKQAYHYVQTLLARSTHPNLFDDHPPFQIDGNFGGTAGIVEMLLQSHLGKIELLPALPQNWSTGYVKGIKARGGFTVNIEWENGQLRLAEIQATGKGSLQVSYKNHSFIIEKEDGTRVSNAEAVEMNENERIFIKSEGTS
ncbi:glycoside hydrolase family 95 protein [Metabacillus halosaccharovorans]|uniref:glycoside hydrolase family 95 protein n=1 Tax=Metabacillus halosaccharovorans TaxID=930124 RepID=UPI000994DDCF|nr:glycoside hydrolase family 95 protein [Metabacillus halosaccharovorans]